MDHYHDKWTHPPYQQPITAIPFTNYPMVPSISAEEIAEFRKLLERAREYDKRNNEPDCEIEGKRQAILTIAKQLGVEISFL
jgi:hypothetical protein